MQIIILQKYSIVIIECKSAQIFSMKNRVKANHGWISCHLGIDCPYLILGILRLMLSETSMHIGFIALIVTVGQYE